MQKTATFNNESDASEPKNYLLTFALYFILSATLFYSVFFIVTVTIYAHHDDYSFWMPENALIKFFTQLFDLGRPLAYYLAELYSHFLKTINDGSLIRKAAILMISLGSALTALWLYSLNLKKIPAFLISISIFTLPGFAVFASYITGAIMLVAVVSALIGGLVIGQIKVNHYREILSIRHIALMLAGLSLLETALLINPPCAMMFITAISSLVIFSNPNNWPQTRLRLLIHFFVFGVALLGYFIGVKIYLSSGGASGSVREDAYAFKVSLNFLDKFKFFTEVASPRSFNLWLKEQPIYTYVAALILTGIFIRIFQDYKKSPEQIDQKRISYYLQVTLAITLLLLMSFTPNLAASSNFAGFRHTFVYSAMVVLLLAKAFETFASQFPKNYQNIFFKAGLFLMATTGIFSAQQNASQVAVNAFVERSYIGATLAPYFRANKDIKEIFVINSTLSSSVNFIGTRPYHDEVGIPTTHFSQDIPWLFSTIFQQYGKDPSNTLIRVDSANPTVDPDQLPDDTLIIDMANVQYPMGLALSPVASSGLGKVAVSKIEAQVKVSNPNTSFPVSNAFDNSTAPSSFWEIKGIPQWVELHYSESTTITRYSLLVGEYGARMPKAWKFQASEDGGQWTDLDQQTNQVEWQGNEKREYTIASPKAYNFYRFFFTELNDSTGIMRIYELAVEVEKKEDAH